MKARDIKPRDIIATVMPKDAVTHIVIANGVKMLVSEVFPSDGRSFILVGSGPGNKNHWERVYDNETLRVVG